MDLADGILARSSRAVARAISLVENRDPQAQPLVDSLYRHCGRATIIGITGSPGSGKSTLTDRLIARERAAGRTVAVIAVDPSSPFTGGAILGDRLRMQDHATDPGVFIRSMASRGSLGGLAVAAGDAVRILDAAGYDTLLIETIGVGQTEVDVVELADLVLLVLMPGAGDEIQALKAGVMEIGDFYVINKDDLPGADKLRLEVEYVLSLSQPSPGRKAGRVFATGALRNRGVDELHAAIRDRTAEDRADGSLATRRSRRTARQIESILRTRIHEVMDVHLEFSRQLPDWVDQVERMEVGPYALVDRQIDRLLSNRFPHGSKEEQ
ncbi:MAG: methylmalonyl Co-A mutase-associated GTPase MeaB [Spirochaetaceae bacterium]|nr:MAG: methylmalonyl Co-A mutase-associated GTPase MeaB [Spirochaetaceae bacterium]